MYRKDSAGTCSWRGDNLMSLRTVAIPGYTALPYLPEIVHSITTFHDPQLFLGILCAND